MVRFPAAASGSPVLLSVGKPPAMLGRERMHAKIFRVHAVILIVIGSCSRPCDALCLHPVDIIDVETLYWIVL